MIPELETERMWLRPVRLSQGFLESETPAFVVNSLRCW
jgi:hypothetical protein